MSARLFIGNLPYDTTEAELRDHFAQVGPVSRVFIPLDRETGRVRGFAFVEFDDAGQAATAIQQLHEKPFKERALVVNEARPSESRPPAGRVSPRTTPDGAGRTFGPPARERTTVGEGGERPRRPAPARSRRRRGGRGGGFWDEGPKKEPIPEKRRSQIFGAYDDTDEDEEEIDFENFATGLRESEDED